MTIGQGQQGGTESPLAPWDVRFVPDGVYTLSLVATDRAGLVDRVPRRRHTGRPPAHGRSLPPARRRLRDRARPDRGNGQRRQHSPPGSSSRRRAWPRRPTSGRPSRTGRAAVEAGTLAEWSPLPPDGVYTLRLTARDKVELSASTRVTVTVDTTPPAQADRPAGEGHEGARGLRPRRGDLEREHRARPGRLSHLARRRGLVSDLLPQPAWDDGERIEGRYTYSVVAVDKAGNVSLPAPLPVLVDLTPPNVAFLSPPRRAPRCRARWRCGARPTASTTSRSTACSSARARRRRPGRSCRAPRFPSRRAGSASGWRSPTARTSSRSRPTTRTATARGSPGPSWSTPSPPGRPCSSRWPVPARRPTGSSRGGSRAPRPTWPATSSSATGGWRTRPGSCSGTCAATWCRGPPMPTTGSPTGVTATTSWPWTEPATSPLRRTRSAPRWTTVRPSPSSSSPPTGRASAPPSGSWLTRPTWTWRASGSS